MAPKKKVPTKTNPKVAAKKNNRAAKRKSRSFPWWYWLVAFLILGAMGGGYYLYGYWQELQERSKAEAAIYTAFGTPLPPGFNIIGIDVSRHQGYIAWDKTVEMRAGSEKISFAVIKATEGIVDSDPNFDNNFRTAKELGLTCGAYHYFLPSKSGIDQARNLLCKAPLSKGDLPPVIDIEQINLSTTTPDLMRMRLREFIDTLTLHYHAKPILYTYINFYDLYLQKGFDDCPLWIAHYTDAVKPKFDKQWLFWQFSEQGHASGITTKVDLDVFNGDSTAFSELLLK